MNPMRDWLTREISTHYEGTVGKDTTKHEVTDSFTVTKSTGQGDTSIY